VTRRVGLSPKQVQRLLEPNGLKVADLVLEQSLQRARRLLTVPAEREEKSGASPGTGGSVICLSQPPTSSALRHDAIRMPWRRAAPVIKSAAVP
jgi:hypothetical protein